MQKGEKLRPGADGYFNGGNRSDDTGCRVTNKVAGHNAIC
jgi:hypothetical protein